MSSIMEARSLWEFVEETSRQGHASVLATLVSVRGSAYRRPGAKMIICEDGRMRGTLSGGCLEGELFLQAEHVFRTKKASLHHYELAEDDMWGLGIGCKGSVDIWLEPVVPDEPFWQAFGQAVKQDRLVWWGAEIPQGRRFLMTRDWRTGDVPDWVRWSETWSGPESGVRHGYWWDVMRPADRVILCGAGHDAEPVARLARWAGFTVAVLDPRPQVNNGTRFPEAEHWVSEPGQVDPEEVMGSYWVIMNHHKRRDEDAIRLASRSQPRFVGILGPRQRTDEMLAHIEVNSLDLPIHAPVGLDLGAETPDEVAVSIVAELMAVRRGGSGRPLNGRAQIHA
ncbi:Xanthine dehydrogenase [Sulfobacillus acidophilus TPY]|uniref:Xanthine dehydrogenase n=1 Tax=Sulfobacillus acidophilus (strain ATCC 700253 / DSM 10332 / NAL) TaxID=679936 RepID=G8TTK6_SULAD|nr:Xanthine dehydrogenase [Sulfobacillus acidophilus TPY]AEW05672.1 Xanthine dehydrogenase [Sulfobacillus acidophilus DSM 10332]